MKKMIMICAMALGALCAQAQTAELTNSDGPAAEAQGDEVFAVVERMPEFPGGQQELFKFIYSEMQYPMLEVAQRHQGRSVCQFVVNTDGSLSDIEVVRSSGYEALDKEAIRIISRMPNWKPGKQLEKVVRVRYTIPILFKLEPIIIQPQFTGGSEAQKAYLDKNMKYPKDAKKALQEGTAVCQFTVGEDGTIKNPEVFVSTGVESLDQEVLRLIKGMPKWTPGTSDEKPTEMQAATIINFSLPAEFINKASGIVVTATAAVDDRTVAGTLPVPACQEKTDGEVTLRVLIGTDGKVVSVRNGESEPTINPAMVELCRNAALKATFSASERESVGTITYTFKSKK